MMTEVAIENKRPSKNLQDNAKQHELKELIKEQQKKIEELLQKVEIKNKEVSELRVRLIDA